MTVLSWVSGDYNENRKRQSHWHLTTHTKPYAVHECVALCGETIQYGGWNWVNRRAADWYREVGITNFCLDCIGQANEGALLP